MNIVFIAFGAIALAIISVLCIIKLPAKRHRKENKYLYDNYAQNAAKKSDCLLLERLIMREQIYYSSYYLWQTVSKVCGILGIILSVFTLAMPVDIPIFYEQFFTILSILLVIFALYLLPEHKYKDYWKAHRTCADMIEKIVTGKMKIEDYAEVLEKIESSITSDTE